VDNIDSIINDQQKYFSSNKTKDINFRIEQLKKLKSSLAKNEKEIYNSLKKDLNNPEFECYFYYKMLIDEINFMIKNLKYFSKPKNVKTPLMLFKSKCKIYYEPYGIVLIIGAWNVPYQITLLPLIGAIAAGNCSIIKPSELSPNTSKIISKIINESFNKEYCCAIEGGIDETTELLNQKFDFIFYTGSTQVGKIIAQAAAKNLTPVVLELGGKSPCIVDKNVNVDIAAKRIIWSKFLNAGQICTSPDYLLIHKEIKDEFIKVLCKFIKIFFGEIAKESEDYSRIINEKHFNRLVSLLNTGSILIGGKTEKENLFIEPTIIDRIKWDDKIMEDEIFGPILPVIEYDNLSEVIIKINEKEKPLALYIYSNDKKNIKKIINETSSGGIGINVCTMHYLNQYLPFGGIGNSGMGNYHGKASFETFSHKKSSLNKSINFDTDLLYPPYKNKLKLLRKFF
jgi:aldehyde dehydrogenase (NAD+)